MNIHRSTVKRQFRHVNEKLRLSITCLLLVALPAMVYAGNSQAQTHGKKSVTYPVTRFLIMNDYLYKQNNQKALHKLQPLALTWHGKTLYVSTCREFIKHISDWKVQESVGNMKRLGDYQACIVRAIFKRGKASHRTLFHHDFPSLIYTSLNMSSFPSSLHGRVSQHKTTLKSLGFKHGVSSETTLLLKQAGREYRFDLLAKGDFTHDGHEDLLVSFIEKGLKGNYFANQTLVLTRKSKHKLWQATTGIDFIRHFARSRH